MSEHTDDTTRDALAWRALTAQLAQWGVDAAALRVYANDTEHPQAREVFGTYGVQNVRWTLRALHDAITARDLS